MIEHYIILLFFIFISICLMFIIQGKKTSLFIINNIISLFLNYFTNFFKRYFFKKYSLNHLLLFLSLCWFISGWYLQIQLKGVNTVKAEITGQTPETHIKRCYEYMDYLSLELGAQIENKNISRNQLNKYLKQNCYDCFYGGKYSFNKKGYLTCSKHGRHPNAKKVTYAK